MKLLFIGLVPVLLFWFVEEKFGTLWGLVAAMVWAIGECTYLFIRYRKVDRMTLFSTGLVLVLGGLGAWLDQGVLFKFQPVIVELIFAGILWWGGRRGEPLLYKMARESKPEIFANKNEAIQHRQKILMVRMSRNLILMLIIHSLVMAYFAVKGTTSEWAFWKGIGFMIFMLAWAGIEFLMIRRQARSSRR
jgi:intracellular septation protein A